MADPLVITYFTPGPYKREFMRLSNSAQRFGLHLRSYRLLADDWLQATRAKPYVISHFCQQFPHRDLLYVDADAYFMNDPRDVLADLPRCDLGVHYFGGETLCSGTLWLPASGDRAVICRHWAQRDESEPDRVRPQRVLQRLLSYHTWRIHDLPAFLCWIFDLSRTMYGQQDAIIEHTQASRSYRKPHLRTPAQERREAYVGTIC